MIKQIQLINFEGHKDTILDLSKGVHIISGDSNAGKSSIFRALRFVFLNEPGGEEFINFDADECSVIIDYNDNIITRTKARNNKKNEYKLNNKEFKAFGQNVPEEIKQVLRLNEINFEWQFDKRPFLISETGGYIASKLNEIVNLELIDSSLRKVEALRRSKNKEIENAELSLKSTKDEIDSLNWIEKYDEELTQLETLESSTINLKSKIDTLYSLTRQIENTQQNLDSVVVLNDNDIVESKRILESLDSTRKSRNSARNKISEIERTNILLDNIGVVLSDRKIDNVKLTVEELKKNKYEYNLLKTTIRDIEHLVLSINDVEREIESLIKQYSKIAPDICPLCGNEFKKELK